MYIGILRFNGQIIQASNKRLEPVLNELVTKVEQLKKQNKYYSWQMKMQKQLEK